MDEILDSQSGMEFGVSISPIGSSCFPIQFRLGLILSQPLVSNQVRCDLDGERTSTKAGPKYLIILGVAIPADEFVEIPHIPFQAVAEHPCDDRERLERRAADSIVVKNLVIGPRHIEGFKETPNVGPPYPGGGTARSIR
jgi:hypothetical protein